MKKGIVKILDAHLPIDEIRLEDDQLIALKGGAAEGGSGNDCNCDCSPPGNPGSGNDCNCRCTLSK